MPASGAGDESSNLSGANKPRSISSALEFTPGLSCFWDIDMGDKMRH